MWSTQRLGGLHEESSAHASEQLGSVEARLQQSQLMLEQVCFQQIGKVRVNPVCCSFPCNGQRHPVHRME